MSDKALSVDNQEIPSKIKRKLERDLKVKRIRALFKMGWSMEDICVKERCSKTTVFYAVNKGRNKNKNKNKK